MVRGHQAYLLPSYSVSCANCPHCGVELPADYKRVPIYRKELRPYLLKPLFELCRSGKGLTLKEITEFGDSQRVHDHFGTLALWRFIRKDGGKYFPTEHGKNFVNGFVRVPEAVYTLSNVPVAAPDDEPPALLLYVWELAPKDFLKPSANATIHQPRLLVA